MSEQSEPQRTGHAEIRAASRLHPRSGAWAFFMREIVRLPQEMTPSVLQVIALQRWTDASDPLEAIRSAAIESHQSAWAKPGVPRSIRLSQ
jgi:hypothetical protein